MCRYYLIKHGGKITMNDISQDKIISIKWLKFDALK